MTNYRPTDERQMADLVTWATAEEQPLEIVGGGSKRALGRPLQVEHTLDLSAFSGIRDYEAAELVLTAGAATPLAEIERALAERNQMLAFEPVDWRALLGTGEGTTPTLGGVLSCNLSGPRRIKAGAARDHFLGVRCVNGRGEAFKAGGQVVKNVTGYDLCKLLAGGYGTLAAMTEVTVKVLPRPEKTRTVLLLGLDDAAAIRAMSDALNTPHEVSAAAHVPADLAASSGVSYVAGAGRPVTALRVEGPGPSVEYRTRALREMLSDGHAGAATEELHSMNSVRFWQEIAEARPLLPAGSGEAADDGGGRSIWRLSVTPSRAAEVAAAVARSLSGGGARHFYDWGGGLLWVAVSADESDRDAGAAAIRSAVAAYGGGHATLVRAPDPVRAAVPVFEPLAPPLAALTKRVKESFDPRGIFNPGRLYRGI
jgi:glycolate oxidase FAD binding subunit